MRRFAALVILGAAALLLSPEAPGVPDVPGDPSPPVVTPVITGALGSNGWYTTNVTVNWSIVDPESIILSTSGCNAITLTANTPGTQLTCSAESDGGTTTVAKTFKVDKTPPAATATPSRIADANGWFNHELSVDFTGTDGTSGLEFCSPPQTYAGPDSPGTPVGGTCRDRAGNTAPASVVVKYDETSPAASPSARPPDANGWHNHAVTVIFQGADATSGVESCSQMTYAGPDDPSVALSGVCRDRAGNESASSLFTLKYDETDPVATATVSRDPDVNGWYSSALTVSFAGSDATSGLESCDAAKAYSGPDSGNASVAGSCRDLAGNVAARSVLLKYDATAPQITATPARAANANGWYNAPLTVSFTGTDPTSGVASCDASKLYSGPDNAAASVTGTCRDTAGNTGNGALALKYDATAPQTSATPSRQPNANGWYNAPLTVAFAGTDGTSQIDSCDAAKSYSGPDSVGGFLGGSCRDRAGNSSQGSLGFKYDSTAPQVTTAPRRPANANGWFNAPITVDFTGGDATSGVDACAAAKTYSGPDNAAAAVTGTCLDKAGNTGSGSFAVAYDATQPQVTASPGRPANANGWHNAPIAVNFTGGDATSGVESCEEPRTYSGPDSASAAVGGTCQDRAGNTGSGSLALKYDATAPLVLATPSPAANANGWHRAPVTVTFTGSDATAGIESCDAAKTYPGPDSTAASVGGTCRDKAGNAGAGSSVLKYDATPPVVTASPARPPNPSGWYTAPLSINFTGGDATSGLESCDGAASYSGPDTPSVSVGGGCRDKAGNLGSGSVALKYDATGPQATATPSRQPNANGWYNAPLTVSFAATDPVSGLDSCPAAQSYGGPDSASAVVSGTCLDIAGNGTLAALPLKYDATAPQASASPSRASEANGWYSAPLTVSFAGADATSGLQSCTPSQAYSTPDTASASVAGSCGDRAGNASAQAAFAFKYDATPPVVTQGLAVRPPDQAGWYNRPVAFAVQGTDATSGLDSCPPAAYAGPDSAEASFSGVCLDKAGNRGTKSFPLKYDATGPQVAASPSRGTDVNGWYNRAVGVSFAGSDPVSGLESCAPPESYAGPDSGAAVVAGICSDRAGNVGVGSLGLRYDATAPQVVGAIPNRPPDANGWYSRPLTVGFHGTDATSEIEACTEAPYAGPDAGAASVTGSCRDRAGNSSGPASFALRYDATAPTLTGATVKAGNRTAVLSWTASPDTALVEIRRSGVAVYRGLGRSFTDKGLKNGTRYRYTLTGYDEARNTATRTLDARPTVPLLSPLAGATVAAPPRLAWRAVDEATYYNVQVWRRGKIFSAWPKGTSVRLPRTWTFAGRRYRLAPGRYRWYVWPGYGRRAKNTFGPLLGSSSFVVR